LPDSCAKMGHRFEAPLRLGLELTLVKYVREQSSLRVRNLLLDAGSRAKDHWRVIIEQTLVQLRNDGVTDFRNGEPDYVWFEDISVIVYRHWSRCLEQQIGIAPKQIPLFVQQEVSRGLSGLDNGSQMRGKVTLHF